MKVWINGEPVEVDESASVAELVRRVSEHPDRVAVALNGELLPRAERDRTTLGSGDRLEILVPQGGG